MPAILNALARVMCIHGGQVVFVPSQQVAMVGGAPALTMPDLMAATIVGCPQAGPGIKPCTKIITGEPALSASPVSSVAGMPLLIAKQVGAPAESRTVFRLERSSSPFPAKSWRCPEP